MNASERNLDRELEALARQIGALDGFEQEVAASIRRIDAVPAGRGVPLEDLVGESLSRALAPGARRRRLVGALAAAAAVVVALVFVPWHRAGREVLASIEADSGGFEVRPVGQPDWRAPQGPVALGAGDEVRAGETHGVRIRVSGGGHLVLHPASTFRIERVPARPDQARLRASLLQGALDVENLADGAYVLVVRAGDSECRVVDARVQVRRAPERGTLFAAFRGQPSVSAGGTRRELPAGTGIFVGVAAGDSARPRLTSFTLDNQALAELLRDVRARWSYYVQRESRRSASGRRVVTGRLGGEAKGRGIAPGASLVFRLERVPFPGAALRENARRFLAAHTEDDLHFAADSLEAALVHGLPEIAGRAVQALALMGRDAPDIERQIEDVAADDANEGVRFARMAAQAALGNGPAVESIRAALGAHRPLATRSLAVLAVAGLGDATLSKEVFLVAQGSAGDLYRDWQASVDFCSAVGNALLRGGDRIGADYARELVGDRSLEPRARRRFLSGLARELRDRPAAQNAFLLDIYPRVAEPEMQRAVVMELLRADPVERDAQVAGFFRSLAEEGGPLAALALAGLAVFAPAAEQAEVEDWLLEQLGREDGPVDVRAAAAQAFAALGHGGGRATARVLDALEAALEDPAVEVRYWAARTLGVIGRPATLAVVLGALEREADPACLTALAQTVARIPGAAGRADVTEHLLREIGAPHPPHVRNAFIQALGELGTDLCRMILEDLAAIAEDPEVRRAAQAALESLEGAGR
ncbi:MAG: HEAT repeat domain-containing protein [Planctomycetes bacterium]|nr:HEAT repeat domain-containing protein [Planctomycetota bacterium]